MPHLVHLLTSPRAKFLLPFFLFFVASQIFWIIKLREWKRKFIARKQVRFWLGVAGWIIYVLFYFFAVRSFRRLPSPTRLTVSAVLLKGPFEWWIFGSVVGFAVYLVVRGCGVVWHMLAWFLRRRRGRAAVLPSCPRGEMVNSVPESVALSRPSRRRFFQRTASVLSAAPFVAGAYGAFYGRLNLKVTDPRIVLPHLPAAFEGFRILQLSDLHIGPFMTAGEIRRLVEIANSLNPEMVALTGDFITWDPSTQYTVVDALSGLRAPFGVFGCLGNHEIYTHTERSITALFAARGIKILRQENSLIRQGGEAINLIGVDFETHASYARGHRGYVRTYLEGVKKLMMAAEVNILMSHNPNVFDRATSLGIDLTLAGHTHGGQIAVELLHVNLSPARLITPYVRGWFRKGNQQLYVNRGIGTIGVPIRVDAPPEITVYRLSRAG